MSTFIQKEEIKHICLFLILSALLCSCQKESDTNKCSGHYALASITWQGDCIDMDGDGIGRRDLLEEMSGIPGFDMSQYEATVDDSISVTIPVPVYKHDDSGYSCTGIDKLTIKRIISIPENWGGYQEQHSFRTASDDMFLKDITDYAYVIIGIGDKRLTFTLSCSLPSRKANNEPEMENCNIRYVFPSK